MHSCDNDTPTTEIYTLSLHDALPISGCPSCHGERGHGDGASAGTLRDETGLPIRPADLRYPSRFKNGAEPGRSEEHTSELQSHVNLVCRLLLEKKKETEYTKTDGSKR